MTLLTWTVARDVAPGKRQAVLGWNPNGRYHGIPRTSAAVSSRAGYTRSQYLNNPQVQIRVGAKDIKGRYHTPCQAWAFWRRHHWWISPAERAVP